ncbi:MAG: hypothetical protein QMC90_02370 [Dehalococcoidales bacterium]|nr:hypothetical protein [Dehalococcoidales bacterium]
MLGKSRRGRRRHPSRSKKGKARRSHSPLVAQGYKPVPHPEVPTPSVSVPTLTTVRYPYIITELQRIGILAGIMLAILVVLALVLS